MVKNSFSGDYLRVTPDPHRRATGLYMRNFDHGSYDKAGLGSVSGNCRDVVE